MIHEEICTYEVAKLAKEKGFSGRSSYVYNNDKILLGVKGVVNWHKVEFIAPTQSLLQRWLREKKNIHIAVFPNLRNSYEYDWIVYIKGVECWLPTYSALNDFATYELALEDALKYALENLGRTTDQELKELMAKDVDDDYNIYDQFNYECDKLWQLITRLCLNANPPIRVREHTLKSLKEAGVHCKLKFEGRTSKLELWRGDELVGVVISTKPERVEIGFD